MTAHARVFPKAEPADGTQSSVLYRRFGKRIFDVALVIAALPVLLPVLAIILLLASFGGRPLYSQIRVGRNGRPFRMWKIRTMVPDADATLKRHLAADPALREEWESKQKLRNDPRITRFGSVLRKTSLDELPQVWNVLVGDMAVVGPRPFLQSQAALYHGAAYYRLRPGMTGPWQVSERNTTSFLGRVQFDDEYDRELSFGHDVSIVARTVAAITRGTGC